jgi:hypothetical protein
VLVKLLVPLFAVIAISAGLVVACDDDDENDDEPFAPTEEETATPEPTDTVEPTVEPTSEATSPPTTEPGDDDEQASACVDDPADLLPTIIERLNAGDAEGVFNCFSADARQAFGPDLQSFADGAFHSFEEGLGSFPAETPVVFTQEIEDGLEQVAVTAIMGDRMVEGTAEEDAVYATLAVFEDGSWRADPVGEFSLSEFSPEPLSAVSAGPLTVAYTVTDIELGGESTIDARIFFNGGQVTEPATEAFEGLRVTGDVTAQAGANWVIAYVEQDGGFAVFGWSFQGQ